MIAAEMAQARTDGVLLVAQSNAGLPQVVGDHFEYDADPDDLAAHATRLAELGIDLIGGCCGSTPAHIAAMAKAVQGLPARQIPEVPVRTRLAGLEPFTMAA